ncbi:MAG: PilZ domain-containing protein [Eubacterium sp.]|nr:PilZ domain-containing protein [Eubacterium sp.]MCM1217416.1 PilZ domain-containing protein [Lachnospiraceae bacterium]MCM1238610.1 PilZ domain-containing protein [Lachnospiraceae bacterium]
MNERRKSKRTSMPSRLMIKRLDGGEDRQVTIEVTDVSKSGIGFECKEQLQVGEVYESFLTIWTKEVIHAILRIVRIELKEQMYSYGAVFVGMPDTESARIEVYQTVEDVKKNQ